MPSFPVAAALVEAHSASRVAHEQTSGRHDGRGRPTGRLRRALMAAPFLALALATPRAASAFAVYNLTTGATANAKVPQDSQGRDWKDTLEPGESGSCHWSNTDCNNSGRREQLLELTIEVEQGRFMCKVKLQAGGYAVLEEEDRSSINARKSYSCTSYDYDHQVVDRTQYVYGTDPSTRSVEFLATGDPQYDRSTAASDEQMNTNADETFARIGDVLQQNRALRGLVVAGDLTQHADINGAREWNRYVSAIAPYSHYVFEGLGNHDTYISTGYSQCYSYYYCTAIEPAYETQQIIDWIAYKKRASVFTNTANSSPSAYGSTEAAYNTPHYSWDWHDVHFVQLNLFGGDTTDPQQSDDELHPFYALKFLKDDLERHVGSSGRPVVLVQHYGFDPYYGFDPSKANGATTSGEIWWTNAQRLAMWQAIANYNVTAILTGHWHADPSTTNWAQPWNRPSGTSAGPDFIPTFNVGAALYDAFVYVSMDQDIMYLARKDDRGRTRTTETLELRGDIRSRNLAYKKPTKQSSDYDAGTEAGLYPTAEHFPGLARHAVDGYTGGDWLNGSVTHTREERSPWWQVDLEQRQEIGEIVLYNRTDCCRERLYNFSVMVSDDEQNWVSFPYHGVVDRSERFLINRGARYVRVQLHDEQYPRVLSLAEVQVRPAGLTLKAKHSGMVLDVYEGSQNDGTRVVQWPALGGKNQEFSRVSTNDGHLQLKAQHSGKCLALKDGSTADRTPIVQMPCDASEAQKWSFISDGDGSFTIVHGLSGKCMDIEQASTTAGASVILWPCHSEANQLFSTSP